MRKSIEQSWTPKQMEFLQLEARKASYFGGIGAGKSYVLTWWAFQRASMGRVVLYVLPTYNMINDIAIPTLKKHLEAIGAADYGTFRKQPPEYHIGKGVIKFRSGTDLEKLRGINAHDAVFDEISLMDRELVDVVLGRVRADDKGQVRAGGTPKGTGHWSYKMFFDEFGGWSRITQTTLENPFIPDEYKQDLLDSYGGDFLRQEVYGEWVEGENSYQFCTTDIITKALQRLPSTLYDNHPVVAGLDPARSGTDLAVLVVRKGDKLTYVNSKNKCDAIELEDWVCGVCVDNGVQQLIIDGGGLGGPIFDHIKRRLGNGVKVIESNASYKPTDSHYANERYELWHRGREWLKETGSLRGWESVDWQKEYCSIKFGENKKGQLLMESKEAMKNRGVDSPNFADALNLTFRDIITPKPTMVEGAVWFESRLTQKKYNTSPCFSY